MMARISGTLCLWQCFQCFCELRKVTGKAVPFFMLRRADMLTTAAVNLGLGQDKEEILIWRTDHRLEYFQRKQISPGVYLMACERYVSEKHTIEVFV